ncbi:ActS/PrrB/RegB family redox-sensitive histidine kinase [Salinarimonas chemoclinalis]|uniref:ActS/PrrB/RegB family redox-sensitive histidine kinase n=1 Tax=Salinarimonas chemoclinalis TaxID=3241599 RepID=UPI0035572B8A
MNVIEPHRLTGSARRLRLDTLVRLRWLAVIGQSAAVAGVHFGLGYSLPFGACFVLIAASAWLNLALRVRYPASHRLSDDAATFLLAFDVAQLAALLFLTGGLQNPFAILFLAPVLISATALTPRRTLLLGALVVACATALGFAHLPLPWREGEVLELPFVYVVGVWAAILLGTGFTGVYAWRVAEEARQLSQALAATELVLAREQHLSQIDGLAAAAAHELGTPLATIALVAKELSKRLAGNDELAEDVTLLREQVERCRGILGQLTSRGEEADGEFLERMTLMHLVEDLVDPMRGIGVAIRVARAGEGPPPRGRRNAGLVYGLTNLLDNAVDFAEDEVVVEAGWDDRQVWIEIRDDGPGFPAEVLLRLGEPYVTTRGHDKRGPEEEAAGHGLGVFIAKTLIERTGAQLTLTNGRAPEVGAIARVAWSRAAFESGG